jgi:hypothetical protein
MNTATSHTRVVDDTYFDRTWRESPVTCHNQVLARPLAMYVIEVIEPRPHDRDRRWGRVWTRDWRSEHLAITDIDRTADQLWDSVNVANVTRWECLELDAIWDHAHCVDDPAIYAQILARLDAHVDAHRCPSGRHHLATGDIKLLAATSAGDVDDAVEHLTTAGSTNVGMRWWILHDVLANAHHYLNGGLLARADTALQRLFVEWDIDSALRRPAASNLVRPSAYDQG